MADDLLEELLLAVLDDWTPMTVLVSTVRRAPRREREAWEAIEAALRRGWVVPGELREGQPFDRWAGDEQALIARVRNLWTEGRNRGFPRDWGFECWLAATTAGLAVAEEVLAWKGSIELNPVELADLDAAVVSALEMDGQPRAEELHALLERLRGGDAAGGTLVLDSEELSTVREVAVGDDLRRRLAELRRLPPAV